MHHAKANQCRMMKEVKNHVLGAKNEHFCTKTKMKTYLIKRDAERIIFEMQEM